ncbi:unnamed protein product [Callosobruchus maculatus]|uniref:Uncharacterized protein n=1 Tax=Callosobruchus maculatus TaxID=64391 RepID=A0A653CXR9_CALMS|nr:unnamed protein product [Callosobruchus maculatus]
MGVPYHLVFLIQQLYESRSARVRIDGNLSGQTATRKGVRQGCVLSPMIFNIYSEFVMRQVLNNWNGQQHSAAYGLSIKYNKTKVMIVDREQDNHREIKSIGHCEVVQSFVYLGSLIDNSGSCENEIRRRIQQAQLPKCNWLSLLCSPYIFLYASATWTVKKADRARIDAFEMWTWRRMLRVPYTAHRTNVSILDELGNLKRLSSIVSTRMLTFFGHIHRSNNMKKLVVQGHEVVARYKYRIG